MARPEGLEPSTPGLEDRCAIQVSYGPRRSFVEQRLVNLITETFIGVNAPVC